MSQLYVVNFVCSRYVPRDFILVPTRIYKALGLKPSKRVYLCFGKRQVQVWVGGINTAASDLSIYLSQTVVGKLLLPLPSLPLNLSITDNNRWQIGPLIGVYANRFNKPARPFGEQSSYIRSLSAAATRLNAVCCAFSTEDIDWSNELIRAAIPPMPNSDEDWQDIVLPFPDVIYDRGLFPKGERRKTATAARKVLRKYPGTMLFNPAFFGKWKTHKLLLGQELLRGHLPETRLLSSMDDVKQLVSRHRTVYLKPSGGSSGRGIIRVTSCPDGYAVNFRAAKKVKLLMARDWSQLEGVLKSRLGDIRYIVQQGLDLAKVNGCPFDIRVLVQRNVSGLWGLTGMAARIATPGNYISNIHAGGQASAVPSVITAAFAQTKHGELITEEIRRISMIIASWISGQTNPLYGEIAIDLGVDMSGKVWIIELNAIPGRSVFRRIGALETLAKAIARPMEFAYYLSGFAPKPEKE